MKNKIILISIIILATVLRLIVLDKFPAGLNADEAAIGYNAYSLLQTGKDEHGVSWPLVFQSFNDYKPPLYFYLSLPFIKTLGLNIWAIRLPSAVLGIASVYLIFLLTNLLFNKDSSSVKSRTLKEGALNDEPVNKTGGKSDHIGLLAALLLAISPWHLHFSRGAWEVNVALFLLLLGLWAFFKSLNNSKYLYLSSLSFVFSLYTYHSMRLITPLLILSLIIVYRPSLTNLIQRSLSQFGNHLIIASVLVIIFLLPLGKQMLGSEGRSRFSGVSIFSDQGPLWEALERRRESPSPNSIQTRLIHNKYLSYSRRFIQNYLSHYSPRFLFVTGDEIARSKVPGIGQAFLILAPFYLIGIFNLLKLDSKGKKIVLTWFLIAPLAAALTFQSPHSLRSQNMVAPFTIITALGIYQFFSSLKVSRRTPLLKVITQVWNLVLAGIFVIFLIYSTIYYLRQYYLRYPQELGFAWEYGFDQVADFVKKHQGEYDQIIISNHYDQPYIIMAFFLKYPPDKFQLEAKLEPRDKFGFSTVNAFSKYQFKEIKWEQGKQTKNALIIITEEAVPQETKPIHQINFPNGQPAFKFYNTNN